MQNVKTMVKMITERVLQRIVALKSFEILVKTLFEAKYPEIMTKELDVNAIIEYLIQIEILLKT